MPDFHPGDRVLAPWGETVVTHIKGLAAETRDDDGIRSVTVLQWLKPQAEPPVVVRDQAVVEVVKRPKP